MTSGQEAYFGDAISNLRVHQVLLIQSKTPGKLNERSSTTLREMKRSLGSILFVLMWIIAIPSPRTNASIVSCSSRCIKRYEISGAHITHFVCGDSIPTALMDACRPQGRRKRKASDIFLGKQGANRFLSSHHLTRRSVGFNMHEECCLEGCRHEEIREYCVYFKR